MNSKQVSPSSFLQKLSPMMGQTLFANYSESGGVVTLSYWSYWYDIPVLKDLKITRTKLNEMYHELLY